MSEVVVWNCKVKIRILQLEFASLFEYWEKFWITLAVTIFSEKTELELKLQDTLRFVFIETRFVRKKSTAFQYVNFDGYANFKSKKNLDETVQHRSMCHRELM